MNDEITLEVSAAELNRRFGEIRRRAVQGPVAVTYHGRRAFILQAADQYAELLNGAGSSSEADSLRRRLSVLMDHVSEGYFAIARDWTVADCNRAAELFVGRTRDEMIGRTFDEVFPTARLDLEPVRQAMDFGEVVHIERASSIHPDRRVLVVAFPLPGDQGGVGALFTNVTERTRMLETVKAKDEAIAILLDECRDQLIFITSEKRTIEHWGVGAEHILGWKADDVLGRSVDRVIGSGAKPALGEPGSVEFLGRDGKAVTASGIVRPIGRGQIYMFGPS